MEGLKRQVKREHLKKELNRKWKSPKKEASDVRNARKHLNADVSGPGSSPVISKGWQIIANQEFDGIRKS